MNVPFFTLDRQNTLIQKSVKESISSVIDSCMYILGEPVLKLESMLADYIGVPEVVTVSSGTEALRLSLLMRGVGPGDEVITVSNSYFATAAAIALVGATPVFVDIEPNSMVMDAGLLDMALTDRTRAVIPVHYNGYPCRLPLIEAFCRRNGLSLIEDCAQAFGSKFEGQHVGSIDIGCFSLHPLKVLGAYGDAGFITLSSSAEAERLRQLRNNGLISRDEVAHICGNSRMDTLQAAVIIEKMLHIDEWLKRRKAIGCYYLNNIKSNDLTLPAVEHCLDFNFSSFVVRSANRNEFMGSLLRSGVECKVQYPIAIHQQKPYSVFYNSPLPVTEAAVCSMFSLPISQELTDEEVEYVVESVNRVAVV